RPSGPGDRTPARPAPQYGASSRRDTGAGGGRRPHCRWPVGPSEAVARHTALHAVRPSGRAIAYKVLRAEDGTTRPPPPWEQGIGDARTARQATTRTAPAVDVVRLHTAEAIDTVSGTPSWVPRAVEDGGLAYRLEVCDGT